MEPVRRAVIDIGTNSVKLLVAEVADGTVTPLTERSEQTRLGRGFYEHHQLQREAIDRTAQAVTEFATVAKAFGTASVRVIATSAARDAKNAVELTGAIRNTSGLAVEIISGDQEADWAFQGVLTTPDLKGQALLILDVGGGSAEFILGHHGQPLYRQSFPLGTVRLMEKKLVTEPPTAAALADCRAFLDQQIQTEIRPVLAPALAQLAGTPVQLVGTGGTTTILARMANQMTGYERERIEATRLPREQVGRLRGQLWSVPLEERKKIIGLPPNRADVILFGVLIYETLMEHFQFQELRISTRGLRYAALLQPA